MPPDFPAAQMQHDILCGLLKEARRRSGLPAAGDSLNLDAVYYAHDASLPTDRTDPDESWKRKPVREAQAHAKFCFNWDSKFWERDRAAAELRSWGYWCGWIHEHFSSDADIGRTRLDFQMRDGWRRRESRFVRSVAVWAGTGQVVSASDGR